MESEIAVAFGIVLRKARAEADLTQEQLGLEAGLQRKYISLLELGQKAPSLETVLKLAEGLRRDAAEIVKMTCLEIRDKRTAVAEAD